MLWWDDLLEGSNDSEYYFPEQVNVRVESSDDGFTAAEDSGEYCGFVEVKLDDIGDERQIGCSGSHQSFVGVREGGGGDLAHTGPGHVVHGG